MSVEANSPVVFVAGSLIMDRVVRVPRHPSIGETIVGHSAATFPGGKGANQAVAAAKIGARVEMLARCGDDEVGRQLVSFLKDANVDITHVSRDQTAETGIGHVTVADDGSNSIVILPGANENFAAHLVSDVAFGSRDILVAQLEIPFETIKTLFRKARAANARTILNAAPASDGAGSVLDLTDILIVNEVELAHFSNEEVDVKSRHLLKQTVEKVRRDRGQIVIVTLGDAGVVAFDGDDVHDLPGRKVAAIDTTGAGDCFTGAFAASLAEGAPLRDALNFANGAASISVQTVGAGPSMPVRADVEQVVGKMVLPE